MRLLEVSLGRDHLVQKDQVVNSLDKVLPALRCSYSDLLDGNVSFENGPCDYRARGFVCASQVRSVYPRSYQFCYCLLGRFFVASAELLELFKQFL